MIKSVSKFTGHACQKCGSERKFVETVIDDEFCWDERSKTYQPNGFADDFEHTGNDRCAECDESWTGS